MHKLFQLAILLTAARLTYAQIVSPDKMVSPLPRNPAQAPARVTADFQWLWPYAQPTPAGNKPALLADRRFTTLLRDNLKAPQAMWGMGRPLDEVATTFLAGPGAVASNDNRRLTVTGCVVEHCPQRGLLYIDLGEPCPLIVFTALRWDEKGRTTDQANAPFTMWIFPSRELDPHQLPQALKDSLAYFYSRGGCSAGTVSNAIVVDPSGVPHVIGTLEAGLQPTLCNN